MSIDYEGFPEHLRKPVPRRILKRREDTRHDRLRVKFRFLIWRREQMRCRRCGVACKLKGELWEILHVHEILSRAHGGSDLDPANCVGLCWSCHLYGLHHQTTDTQYWFEIIIVDSLNGADNPNGLKFVPWEANAS
jgi:5-methylcytosine-specific restriction endonuclease McrA